MWSCGLPSFCYVLYFVVCCSPCTHTHVIWVHVSLQVANSIVFSASLFPCPHSSSPALIPLPLPSFLSPCPHSSPPALIPLPLPSFLSPCPHPSSPTLIPLPLRIVSYCTYWEDKGTECSCSGCGLQVGGVGVSFASVTSSPPISDMLIYHVGRDELTVHEELKPALGGLSCVCVCGVCVCVCVCVCVVCACVWVWCACVCGVCLCVCVCVCVCGVCVCVLVCVVCVVCVVCACVFVCVVCVSCVMKPLRSHKCTNTNPSAASCGFALRATLDPVQDEMYLLTVSQPRRQPWGVSTRPSTPRPPSTLPSPPFHTTPRASVV